MAALLFEQHPLISIVIRSFLVLLLTAGLAFALRRRSASVVHGIWAAGLGGCLAIPVVMLLSPNWSLALLPPEPAAEFAPPASVAMRSSTHAARVLLGWLVHPARAALSALVGTRPVLGGITDTCGTGLLLARMPWNRGGKQAGCWMTCRREPRPPQSWERASG